MRDNFQEWFLPQLQHANYPSLCSTCPKVLSGHIPMTYFRVPYPLLKLVLGDQFQILRKNLPYHALCTEALTREQGNWILQWLESPGIEDGYHKNRLPFRQAVGYPSLRRHPWACRKAAIPGRAYVIQDYKVCRYLVP